MTTTVASLLSRADTVLQDAGIRWPDTEKLGWLNEGQRAIITFKPNANTVNASVQLVAGTKQKTPANAYMLFDIMRNMGGAGTTPGRAIRVVTRETLDTQDPDWHSGNPSPVVVHYMYNPVDPDTFYVYPPQPAEPRYVEMLYSAFPADCALNGNLQLGDAFEVPLLEYVLYRAFLKDAEVAASATRAAAHASMFTNLLQGQDGTSVPGLNLAPLNPAGPTG